MVAPPPGTARTLTMNPLPIAQSSLPPPADRQHPHRSQKLQKII
ncbi:hypothetical protein EI77_03330, partial [Prosthecobacter fusiformis]